MTGIFVVARLGSTRLFEKHLIKVRGKTFIEWLVDRFLVSFNKEINSGEVQLFIVTSDKPENKKLETLFSGYKNVTVFFGSDSNIPLRQLQCAELNSITAIISVDGDDILCSTKAAHQIMDALQTAPYAQSTGLPFGMNIFGYQTDFLRKSLNNERNATLETGWGRIFKDTNPRQLELGNYAQDHRLRMTLDYEEDAKFFEAVINPLGNKLLTLDDRSLINFILENNFQEINAQVSEAYWSNFNLKKNEEL